MFEIQKIRAISELFWCSAPWTAGWVVPFNTHQEVKSRKSTLKVALIFPSLTRGTLIISHCFKAKFRDLMVNASKSHISLLNPYILWLNPHRSPYLWIKVFWMTIFPLTSGAWRWVPSNDGRNEAGTSVVPERHGAWRDGCLLWCWYGSLRLTGMMGLQDDLGVFENGVPGVHFFKLLIIISPWIHGILGGILVYPIFR